MQVSATQHLDFLQECGDEDWGEKLIFVCVNNGSLYHSYYILYIVII